MKPSDEELARRFMPHAADAGAHERHKIVNERCLDLAKTLRNVVPDGAGLALALTRLKEASMHANVGIACNLASAAVQEVAHAVVSGDGITKALEDM